MKKTITSTLLTLAAVPFLMAAPKVAKKGPEHHLGSGRNFDREAEG